MRMSGKCKIEKHFDTSSQQHTQTPIIHCASLPYTARGLIEFHHCIGHRPYLIA